LGENTLPADLELSEYEVSLLTEFKNFCERSGVPYIHDNELKQLRGFEGSTVIVADTFEKLSHRGYVEQNSWEASGKQTFWWKMNPAGMVAISDAGATRQPRPHRSSAPGWVDKLHDAELRSILVEVYDARENGFLVLPLMGARTAFDRAMFLKVRDPQGGFGGKLAAMKALGLIDDRSIEILRPMIDAGNAAAHRGMIPARGVLDAVVNEMQRQLHDWFIRDDDASLVRQATPKRSK
jgi:hypothetical protein